MVECGDIYATVKMWSPEFYFGYCATTFWGISHLYLPCCHKHAEMKGEQCCIVFGCILGISSCSSILCASVLPTEVSIYPLSSIFLCSVNEWVGFFSVTSMVWSMNLRIHTKGLKKWVEKRFKEFETFGWFLHINLIMICILFNLLSE